MSGVDDTELRIINFSIMKHGKICSIVFALTCVANILFAQNVKQVVVAKKVNSAITMSQSNLVAIFNPLTSSGFTYKNATIIKSENQIYLVATFENITTKISESIGIILKVEGDFLVVDRAAEIKCSKKNDHCECIAPICGCSDMESKTGYVHSCGKMIVTKKQIADFSAALNTVR